MLASGLNAVMILWLPSRVVVVGKMEQLAHMQELSLVVAVDSLALPPFRCTPLFLPMSPCLECPLSDYVARVHPYPSCVYLCWLRQERTSPQSLRQTTKTPRPLRPHERQQVHHPTSLLRSLALLFVVSLADPCSPLHCRHCHWVIRCHRNISRRLLAHQQHQIDMATQMIA